VIAGSQAVPDRVVLVLSKRDAVFARWGSGQAFAFSERKFHADLRGERSAHCGTEPEEIVQRASWYRYFSASSPRSLSITCGTARKETPR
jgi:hypothetical protein